MDVRYLLPRGASETRAVNLFAEQMARRHGGRPVVIADPAVCPPTFAYANELTFAAIAKDEAFTDGILVIWDVDTMLKGDPLAFSSSCELLRGRRVVLHLLDLGETIDILEPGMAQAFMLFARRDRAVAAGHPEAEKKVIHEIVRKNVGKKVVIKENKGVKRVTEEKKKKIRELRERGFTFEEIAQQVGVAQSRAFVYAKDVRVLTVEPMARMRFSVKIKTREREAEKVRVNFGEYSLFARSLTEFVKTISPPTARNYNPILISFGNWCKAKGVLSDDFEFFNEDNIELWLNSMRRTRSARTMVIFVAAVRKFSKFLKRKGSIKTEPVIFFGSEIVDDGVVKTQPMTEEEFIGILSTARKKWEIMKTFPDRPIATHLAHRNYILVILMAALGARSGSIIELRRCDWDGVSVSLRLKKRYDRLAFRLTEDVAREVNEYVNTYFEGWHGSSWLFPVSMKRTVHMMSCDVGKVVRSLAHDAGITRRISPHMFRVTFALICYRNGMDVHELKNRLAHVDLKMTSAYLRRIDLSKHNKYMPDVVSISKGIRTGRPIMAEG